MLSGAPAASRHIELADGKRVEISTSVLKIPLSHAGALELLDHADCGGRVLFAGAVRDHDGGAAVERLEYSAHPHALEVLSRVVATTISRHPQVRSVVAWHRVGLLEIGEAALLVGAAAPHRAEAFRACEDIVEDIKNHVPIWKLQFYDARPATWSNAP